MKSETKGIIYTILLFFTVTSCTEKTVYENTTTFNRESFGEPILVYPEIVDLKEPPYIPMEIIISDSFLIAFSHKTEKLVYSYNLNTGKKIKETITFGSGPDDMLNIQSFHIIDSLLWLTSSMDFSLKSYPLVSFVSDNKLAHTSMHRMAEPFESLDVLSPESFVGLTRVPTTNRINFYDNLGNLIFSKGEYPSFGTNLTPLEALEGFTGYICSNHAINRLYIFCKLTDLIEVYDLSGNLIKRTHGPDRFFPTVKQQLLDDGNMKVTTLTSKDAYFRPKLVENDIFVIYSGTTFEKNERKIIFVFDKEGNPKKQFKFEDNILTFAADEKNKNLYIVTYDGFEIKKFNYE